MIKGWESKKIKDVAISLIDGDRGKNYPKQHEFSKNDYCLFLNTGNVTLNGFDFSSVSFVSVDKDNSLRKGKLERRDIVLTTRGTIGNLAYYHSKIPFEHIRINSGMLIIRANDNQFDRGFLYQYLKSPVFRKQVKQFQYGAAQPQLPIGTLNHIKITIPPLPTQRKIASILSAYDDLIENNLKRIKLLEEKAQLTYEEWFVRMKFPGHETTSINEETGLPEGWEKVELQDLADVITGKTPSTIKSEYYGVDVPFIKTPDLHARIYMTQVEQYLSFLGANSQKNKFFPKNTILLSCIGARAGAVGLTSEYSQCNQQINGMICKDEAFSFYVYFFSRALTPLLRALGSNGATMTNVSKGKLEKVNIKKPVEITISSFHEKVKREFGVILDLQKQNQLLKEARDILLPRLMMGIIDVDEVEMPKIR